MNKVFSLTQGRHTIKDPRNGKEINKSIFGKELLMNIKGLEDFAEEFINNNGVGHYEIFVTGFTPALTSFIKMAYQGNVVRLSLIHI